MHILDTDIATLVFYGKNEKVVTRYNSFPEHEQLAISIITKAQILRGRCEAIIKVATAKEWIDAETKLQITEEWLDGFDFIAIGNAGEQFERFLKNKKFRFNRGHADLLITCIALANNATLVTRNTKDFAGIPNLKLENWAD